MLAPGRSVIADECRRGLTHAPPNRIPSLDGVRAFSILLVIFGHLGGAVGPTVILSALGVQTFFVLSGYLITRLLQNEHERAGKINLVAFYRRRCFRIFPAAYAFMLVIAVAVPASRPGLLYATTYTVSYHYLTIPLIFQHLWSLSVEEQFYLLWPLGLLLGYRYRARIAIVTMLLAAAFRLGLAFSPLQAPTLYMHFWFPGTMDSIAAGCLLAVYEPQIRERWAWMASSAGIVFAIPFTAWTLAIICWGDTRNVGVRALSAVWGIVPILIALWIFLLVERQDWLFNNPVACGIGVLSYSLYLWQQPFIAHRTHSVLLALLMLTACAVASYFLVERPMLQLGASINARKRIALPKTRAMVSSGVE